jgi:hypothetical protein
MAIYRLFQESAFDDGAVKAMTTAYETALAELGLVDRTDPLTEVIARKIIECAQSGEGEAIRLCAYALRDLGD